MAAQDLVERILSDAEGESRDIIAEAEKTAARILEEARARADGDMQQAKLTAETKAKAIAETTAASARLEGGKILLSAKRAVIDDVYAEAAKKLASMDKRDCLAFYKKLLDDYAEDGDEVVLAENFPYKSDISAFSVVKEKDLKLVFGGAKISGGFVLRGKNSDRDLSIEAMIAADRAQHEAEVAAQLLK